MPGQELNKTLHPSNFNKICRTCLNEGDVAPIFDRKSNDVSVEEALQECISLEIKNCESMPQNICSNCETELYRLYIFRKSSLENDVLLKKALDNPVSSEYRLDSQKTEDIYEDYVIEADDTGFEEIRRSTSPEGNNQYELPKLINKHSKKHTRNVELKKKLRFQCNHCSQNFDTRGKLKEHRKETKHLDVRTHTCSECHKVFSSSKLRQHMRSHTKEKPYQCEVCAQSFSMSGNLKRHIMIHTGERPHICDTCGKGFIQSTSLQAHKKIHMATGKKCNRGKEYQRYICNYCGRGFTRSGPYEIHVGKIHLGKSKEELANGESSNLFEMQKNTCSICHRVYKTKHLLKAHQLTHGERSFLCNECGKGFVTKAALQSHLKVHTGEKPHTCNICHKSFAHIGSFDSHMLIHTGHKPHNCTVCTKSFTQLSHLKYHMRTHSGERPYACSYCGKTFALKGNLTVHVRTHTGETPYLCTVCGKGFYDSSSMKKHKKNHKFDTFDNSNAQKNGNFKQIAVQVLLDQPS